MTFSDEPHWRLTPFPDRRFNLDFTRAPNWFHRLAQRLILGFRWERL